MQWLNEDHRCPLNRSSFKDAALTTDHDLSDFGGVGGTAILVCVTVKGMVFKQFTLA